MEFPVVVVWIVGAVAVAQWAGRRGREDVGWGFIALLISPLLAALLLFILPDIVEIKAQKEKIEQEAQALKKEKLKISGETFAELIAKLHHLFEKKIITEAEYELKKAEAIKNLKQKIIKESPEEFLEALIPLFEGLIISSNDLDAIKISIEGSISAKNSFCSNCNTIITNDSCFCQKCGKPLQDPNSQQSASEMPAANNSSKSNNLIVIILLSLFVLLMSIVLLPIAVVPVIAAIFIYFLIRHNDSVNGANK